MKLYSSFILQLKGREFLLELKARIITLIFQMRSSDTGRGDDLSDCLTVQPLHLVAPEAASHYEQPGEWFLLSLA